MILDIYDQRAPAAHWRHTPAMQLPVAVIDNRQRWAEEADLLVTPGVTAQDTDAALSKESVVHLEGREHLILRREIRREAEKKHTKSFDLLVYLHDQQQKEAVKVFVSRHQLRAMILDGFCPEMPKLLAQSRYYLSGFGISFYEALAVGTFPICWPDSKAHQQDAVNFYQRLNIPDCILETAQDLEKKLLVKLHAKPFDLPELNDGTPKIVDALQNLVLNKQDQKQ